MCMKEEMQLRKDYSGKLNRCAIVAVYITSPPAARLGNPLYITADLEKAVYASALHKLSPVKA